MIDSHDNIRIEYGFNLYIDHILIYMHILIYKIGTSFTKILLVYIYNAITAFELK